MSKERFIRVRVAKTIKVLEEYVIKIEKDKKPSTKDLKKHLEVTTGPLKGQGVRGMETIKAESDKPHFVECRPYDTQEVLKQHVEGAMDATLYVSGDVFVAKGEDPVDIMRRNPYPHITEDGLFEFDEYQEGSDHEFVEEKHKRECEERKMFSYEKENKKDIYNLVDSKEKI